MSLGFSRSAASAMPSRSLKLLRYRSCCEATTETRSVPMRCCSHPSNGPSLRQITRTSSYFCNPAAMMPPTFGAPVRVASCRTMVMLTWSIPLNAVTHLARQVADDALDGMRDLTVPVEFEAFIAAIFEFHVLQAIVEPADDVWADQKHCSRNVFDLAVFFGDFEIVQQPGRET